MSDRIYKVDPKTQELSGLQPVSLATVGIKERTDLQRWVLSNPRLLGEDLLVLSSEFDRFENSRKRPDIVALDKNGMLVVVELKRDVRRSDADLQALRYAAFCSTMTLDDCTRILADYEGSTYDEAAERVSEFLEVEEPPELNNRPRIIIAAGSMDDKELTSCVLWLRGFGLDITCVELAPFRERGTHEIILVPRTIVPIPEARDFLISVERKETVQVQQSKARSEYGLLWQKVAQEFNEMGTEFTASGRSNGSYMKMGIPHHPEIHYEWSVMKSLSRVNISLHFEFWERQTNIERMKVIEERQKEIARDVDLDFEVAPWGRKWAFAEFRMPYKSGAPLTSVAKEAAETMRMLIERTYPIVRDEIIEIKH